MIRHFVFILCLALVCTVATEKMAHAYIDPSTGSYILTVIIGALAGAGFAVKLYWEKLKNFFSKHVGKAETDQNDSPDN